MKRHSILFLEKAIHNLDFIIRKPIITRYEEDDLLRNFVNLSLENHGV